MEQTLIHNDDDDNDDLVEFFFSFGLAKFEWCFSMNTLHLLMSSMSDTLTFDDVYQKKN